MESTPEKQRYVWSQPVAWIVFVFVSLSCVWAVQRYFSEAFPLVALDITMDRSSALAEAAERVQGHDWGPSEYEQAASFELDGKVQYYVELECGGNEAFRAMLAGDLYAPYQWRVRHFQPDSAHEVTLSFTPDGTWYGFVEQLPEDEPGAALDVSDARSIAVKTAEALGIAWDEYEPISASKEVLPSDRVDHTFVFERSERDLGEARYRLRLVVSGDRLTTFAREVFVPEAFVRQYTEMRSANETLAAGASVAMLLLYIGGGCIGAFFLMRQRWILWQTALRWGIIVGVLQGAVALNQLPLSWVYYDTAISVNDHIIEQVVGAVIAALVTALALTLSFLIAESLSRRAFPHHLQLWSLWSSAVAGSPQVLGRTMGGYLLIGPMLAFVVGFYYLNSRFLGWWNPSNALFEPNVLAAYFPWFSSIAISLQAGFWEECLFRAIPLAGAALLGERYGRPRLWIAAAFILQMIIFGAVHANYPAQPAYARLVELLIPSAVFGFLFLRFGLLPAIVMHFAYDVVWFAMPLFVADAPGLRIDQTLVVVLALVPLGIPLFYRWRSGVWQVVGDAAYNAAWQPPAAVEAAPLATTPVPQRATAIPWVRYAWCGVGLIGLALWGYGTFAGQQSRLVLTVDRAEAIHAAQEALASAQIELDDAWDASVRTVVMNASTEHNYVWRTWDLSVYERLQGTFLSAPHWQVRFARFDEHIPVEDRAEEYRVYIDRTGQLMSIDHVTPEGWPGAELGEAAAEALAEEALSRQLGLRLEDVQRISADVEKRPERSDWRFVFSEHAALPEAEGQARIGVDIAGDRIERVYRYVHVPEEWERTERDREQSLILFRAFSMLLLVGLVGTIVVYALLCWSRGTFDLSTFVPFFIAFFAWGALMQANGWSAGDFTLSTTEPLNHQLLMRSLGAVLLPAALAFLIALLAAAVPRWTLVAERARPDVLLGIALGAVGLGLEAVGNHLVREFQPALLGYSGANNFFSWLPEAITAFPMRTLLWAGGIGLWAVVTQHGTRRLLLANVLVFTLGAARAGMAQQSVEGVIIFGVANGLFMLAALHTALRFDIRLCWIAIGFEWMLGQFAQAILAPFPGAQLGVALGVLIVGGFGWWWLGRLSEDMQLRRVDAA